MAPASAGATTTLAVDLSSPIGPAGHVASGSLYGVTETVPTDVMALVAPLHPNMFTNPAADVQQPVGDAIVVAGRVAPIGARVTIRLADLFPSWPYAFTTMTDWSMARDPRRSNEESVTGVGHRPGPAPAANQVTGDAGPTRCCRARQGCRRSRDARTGTAGGGWPRSG